MASGKKTGGRIKGSRNKTTVERREAIAAAGLTPLDYMLSILRDERQAQEARFAAAKDAAPYCHARLASVEHSGNLAISHEAALDALDDEGAGDTPPASG